MSWRPGLIAIPAIPLSLHLQAPPHAPKNQGEKSLRHPGGQPGHQGNHRQLAPPDKMDTVLEHRAEACPHCRSLLA